MSTKITLSDADKALICLALRIAADQFEKDVATAAAEHVGQLVHEVLTEQFEAQVKQARALAETIEDADIVDVVTVTVGAIHRSTA